MNKQVIITFVFCLQAMGAFAEDQGEYIRSRDAQGYNFKTLLEHASTQINLPKFDDRAGGNQVIYTGTCFSVEDQNTPQYGVFLVANFHDPRKAKDITVMSDFVYDRPGDLSRQDVRSIVELIIKTSSYYMGPQVDGDKLMNVAAQRLDPNKPQSTVRWVTTISQDNEGVIHTVNFNLSPRSAPLFNANDIELKPGEPMSVCRFDKVYYEEGVEAPEGKFQPEEPNPFFNPNARTWMAAL